MNTKICNDDSIEIISSENKSEFTIPVLDQYKEDEAIMEISISDNASNDDLQELVKTFERLHKNLSQRSLSIEFAKSSLN